MRIDNGFFQDPDRVAERFAQAWAAQPAFSIGNLGGGFGAFFYGSRFEIRFSFAYVARYASGGANLAGLEIASGIKSLDLGGNRITDLTPLSGLILLETLRLDRTGASDLTPLTGLIRLETLNLSWNRRVVDLSPLQTLVRLSVVHLGANRIEDVATLSGLRKLELLSLGQNQIADIAALAELPDLEYLDLRDNPLDPDALNIHVPALEERGVQVLY